MSRPFFSLVVPCYNDGRYQEGKYLDRLLDNLCKQGLNKEELEVILSDDQSPVPFDDVIAKYADSLDIRHIKTDKHIGPGNTRQCGADVAIGQWLCFADHDDVFALDAFSTVKDEIERCNEQLYCMCDFVKVDADGVVVESFSRPEDLINWVHGKFYNLDNFWRRYELYFPATLRTHEDIALGAQIACISAYLNHPEFLHIKRPLYFWLNNPESVSNTEYVVKVDDKDNMSNFLERNFSDYLDSKWGIYIFMYRKKYITRDDFIQLLMPDLIGCYSLMSQWMRVNTSKYLHHNMWLVKTMFLTTEEVTGLTPAVIKVATQTCWNRNLVNELALFANHNHFMHLYTWMDFIMKVEKEKVDGEA